MNLINKHRGLRAMSFRRTATVYGMVLVCSLSTAAWCGKIVKPWRSTTAIVKAGESFDVWFDADGGQTVTAVELEGPYNTVSCSESITPGDWEYDPMSGNRYDTRITVTVPSDSPADRYDLVLKTTSGDEISYGGVKVVREFKDNYYVMHMSDGHIYQSGYDADVLLARKSALLDMADIMDVQLIIETGDNMYNVRNHPEREGYYFLGKEDIGTRGMAQASAATFLTAGDHTGYYGNDWSNELATEQINADFVNDYWGVQNASVNYGNGRFMMFNNAWAVSATSAKNHQWQIDEATSWLANDGAGGNFFVTAGHCYDKMHTFVHAVEPLDLVMAGDKHSARTLNPYELDGNLRDANGDYYTDGSAPSVAYIAGAIRDLFEFNLYHIDNAAGSFSTPSGSTAATQALFSGNKDTVSTWVPNMELSFSEENTGGVSVNTATIINRFGFPVEGARVRFIMPLGQTYDVSAGTIEQAFDGDSVRVVDVNVDLGADRTTVVDIFAAGMASNQSSFISWDVPTEMEPGETISVDVTMKNSGLDAWTTAGGQKLGAVDSTWGTSRVVLPVSTVGTNQNAVFSFNITAPSSPGYYDLQWQMIDEAGDNTGWFGAKTPSTSIKVGSIAPVVNLISPDGDVSLNVGDDLYVEVEAIDTDGILRVWLYKDGIELARSEGGYPYEWGAAGQDDPELQNLQAGTFELTAKARDINSDLAWTTQSITVTVGDGMAHGANLIQNPSFETGDNTGWSFSTPTATSVITNTAADGTYAVALTLATPGTVSPVRQIISVEPNTDYTFSYWANFPSSGITGSLTARLNVNGVKLKSSTRTSDPTEGWEQKFIEFNSGVGTSITLDVYADSDFTGTVYIDDFALNTIVLPVDVVLADVSGMTEAAARLTLEAQGLNVNSNVIPRGSATVPAGQVIRTSPGAGGLFAPGFDVTLTLSTGPEDVDAYDAWAAARQVVGSMADDDDEDGLNNWTEFAFGGDPTNAMDGVPPSLLRSVVDGLTYTHTQRKADSNLLYTVEVRTNLLEGAWSALISEPTTNGVSNEFDEVTYPFVANDPQAYLRVRLQSDYPPKPRTLYTYGFGGLEDMTVPDAVALLDDIGYGGVAVPGRGEDDLARFSAYQALSDSMGADFVIPAVYMSHRFDLLGFSDAGQRAAIDAMAGTGGTLWMWVGDPDSVVNVAVEVVEDFVAGIVEYAVSNNVKVILYPHYNTYYPTTDDAMVLVEKIDHPSFGVAINLCHELMSEKGDVLAQTFANAKDRIAAVILSGALLELDRTSPGTLNDSTILSLDESEVDLRPFVQLIADSGFEGPVGFINFQMPYATVDYLTRTIARWNELCDEVGLYEVR